MVKTLAKVFNAFVELVHIQPYAREFTTKQTKFRDALDRYFEGVPHGFFDTKDDHGSKLICPHGLLCSPKYLLSHAIAYNCSFLVNYLAILFLLFSLNGVDWLIWSSSSQSSKVSSVNSSPANSLGLVNRATVIIKLVTSTVHRRIPELN